MYVANVQENVCYFTPKDYNRHILKKWNAICIYVDILEKLKKLNVNFIIFNIINHPELRCPQYITTLKMYELKGIAINYEKEKSGQNWYREQKALPLCYMKRIDSSQERLKND